MKATAICDETPRTVTTTRAVPCDGPHHSPSLRVEVLCQTVSRVREDELLRLACAQRIEFLRARLSAVSEVCRTALCAKRTALC